MFFNRCNHCMKTLCKCGTSQAIEAWFGRYYFDNNKTRFCWLSCNDFDLFYFDFTHNILSEIIDII